MSVCGPRLYSVRAPLWLRKSPGYIPPACLALSLFARLLRRLIRFSPLQLPRTVPIYTVCAPLHFPVAPLQHVHCPRVLLVLVAPFQSTYCHGLSAFASSFLIRDLASVRSRLKLALTVRVSASAFSFRDLLRLGSSFDLADM